MNIRQLTIAGGNSTILVWDCPRVQRTVTSVRLLESAEQVGFVEEDDMSARLSMMGGELCINGTIALASLISPGTQLYASGIENSVPFSKTASWTAIQVDLPFKRNQNIILFDNIGYEITYDKAPKSKAYLALCAEQFAIQAFGQVCVQNDQIFPYVYVQQTNSCVAETACGSGSIAYSLFSGLTKVRQPTGQYISVVQIDETIFKISAEVISKEGI